MIAFAGNTAATASACGHSPARQEATADSQEDTERLGDEIARLSAHIHAATYRLLVLIRAFDEREGWAWGFRSCAEWLSWRTGIAPGAAREKVRVARALASLPGVAKAMSRGEMSYSKIRALTRVADETNETELLELARHATAAHMERLVRAWRRVDRLEKAEAEGERHRSRFVDLFPDEDGSWVLRGRLDPEVGALLQKALEWAGEALFRQEMGPEEEGPGSPISTDAATMTDKEASAASATTAAQRRADALGLLAERALAVGRVDATGSSSEAEASDRPLPPGRADRFQVVLHVDAGALEEGSEAGQAVLAESGIGVSAETSRRLACDTGVVAMRHGADGEVLDVGRRRRTVPPAIRRALEHRDGGCRFPGCGCRYTDAHHITHWADGGETSLRNTVLLCRTHHRAVHEGKFQVKLMENEDEIRFYRPDGRRIPRVPTPLPVPGEPVPSLESLNAERGIEPDAWTTTPLWHGEAIDYSLALDMLRHPAAGSEGRR